VDNRSTILDTATHLFAEQGFAGVSLRAIAERVGITKPSLLYHFPSKDQLREEVLSALFDHWSTRLPNLLRAVTSGEGELESLMDALWAFFEEDPDRARLVARELLDRPEAMQARIGASLSPLVTLIARRMAKAQASGILRTDVDPEAFVLHMIALTLANVAAAPILTPLAGNDPRDVLARQRKEMRRIAYTSLFPDPIRVPSTLSIAGIDRPRNE
jgi:TetR/AcrR family transcriptional regulator